MTDTAASQTNNPYLDGNYGPVADEVTAFDLPVIGELPAELAGRYLRNGPNPAGMADGSVKPETHHWFMGDGMVHGIRLDQGKAVWYRNRYVGSANMSARRGLPDIDGPNWADSGQGPNTNVGGFAGTTWAMVEGGGTPVELTYELETVGRNDFYGTLPGAFTAHPKFDADTGEMHAMVYAPAKWGSKVQYVVVGTDGRVRHSVDIELPGMTMLHDMSLTARYAVCFDQPVVVDFDRMGAGYFPFSWQPDYGNRIGLLDRTATTSDEMIWVDVPLGYCFHPLNAYDTPDGGVVLDLCIYDVMFDKDPNGPFERPALSRLERWEISPANRTVSATVIDASPNEFPRHRGSVAGKPYRYGYCGAPSVDPTVSWPTLKHDLETGQRLVFDHGPGRAAGEPVFVARGDDGEDDGWLITYVHDLGAGSAEFVVLDAQDFERGYVARVPLPQRIPFGFHGNWVSDRSVPPS